MMKKYLSLLLILAVMLPGNAQDMSWKKHLKAGEKSFEEKKFAEAAYHFEAAYKKKVKKRELIYNAAESYFLAGDFVRAAKGYKHLVSDNKKYPFARLKYARALKQSGQYGAAETAFVDFIDKYHGEDKELWGRIAKMEIKGCELGKLNQKSTITDDVSAQYLDGINTDFPETAPFPFSDNILYFTTARTGKAQIYRSLKNDEYWQEPELPETFSFLEGQGFGNGVFTPDRKRFYFSMCKYVENWRDIPGGCRLYVMKFEGDKWSEPEKLPDYINEKNAVVTHPFVTYIGHSEVLFFASNMEGTRGGMDIWFSVREIDSDDNDFTFPENAGENVNTIGNEISPYYDNQNGILFFSSNAQVTIGGYDIFQSVGGLEGFEKSINLKVPINSPADDYYFKLSPNRQNCFFASNRYHNEKISDNLYTVSVTNLGRGNAETTIPLAVNEKKVNEKTPVEVIAEEQPVTEEEEIEVSKEQPEIVVTEVADKNKVIATFEEDSKSPAEETGVSETKEDTVTDEQSSTVSKIVSPSTKTPAESAPPKRSVKPVSAPRSYYVGGTSKRNPRAITTAPRHAGVYYKIQLHSVKNVQKHKKRYDKIRKYGQIQTEYILSAKMARVLLSNFYTYEEAKSILRKIKPKLFTKAYLIKYVDGERIGRVK